MRISCPECGNRDSATIEDNGLSPRDPRFTFLCAAPVPAGQRDSFDNLSDGKTPCGTQWEPNNQRDDR